MRTSPLLPVGSIVLLASLGLGVGCDETVDLQPIAFSDLALDPGAGLSYERARSSGYDAAVDVYRSSQETPITLVDIVAGQHRPGGLPGVALIDHDGDGDLDMYVANGPGTANSLFVNQLAQTGALTFVDEGVASGVGAEAQDSQGVCFGDLDNDGDDDLLVMGRHEDNQLFANQGDGTFERVAASGLQGDGESHVSCSLGDVDGDGLLDVFISNSMNMAHQFGVMVLPGSTGFEHTERNQLFRNEGQLAFVDVSEASGVRKLGAIDIDDPTPGTITWAQAMVDIDLDGDVDILHADDEAGSEVARGFIHVLLNDGSGQFVDTPLNVDEFSTRQWMGLAFGDLDCDGHMDVHSTAIGDYSRATLGPLAPSQQPIVLGDDATAWFLGNGDGTFTDPKNNGMPTAFGWGNAIADLDNDGDQDVMYAGGLNMGMFMAQGNPGHILENQGCTGSFVDNVAAFADTDFLREGTQSVVTGDLNGDGFLDVVTTSEYRIPAEAPMIPGPDLYGSPLEGLDTVFLAFAPTEEGSLVWGGVELQPGRLTVEINEGNAAYGSVSVDTVGGVGRVPGAVNNRSGIGAVVSVQPKDGPTAMSPVTAGSSFLGQHQMNQHFGLGEARRGAVTVRWLGGTTTHLSDARPGETVVMPEIPCDASEERSVFADCVESALQVYVDAGDITQSHARRLQRGQLSAFASR